MTKTSGRNRGRDAAHVLYAASVLCLILWIFLPGRAAAAAGVLMYLLPPVAFAIDIMSTETPEESK
jgi:hypothetical protein